MGDLPVDLAFLDDDEFLTTILGEHVYVAGAGLASLLTGDEMPRGPVPRRGVAKPKRDLGVPMGAQFAFEDALLQEQVAPPAPAPAPAPAASVKKPALAAKKKPPAPKRVSLIIED